MALKGSLPGMGAMLILCLVSCQGSTTSPKADSATTVDHYVAGLTRNQGFSGTVLIAQNGKILLDKAYGWADESQRLLNKPSTRFRIGSVTKQFTAMAVLLLQEQGKLRVRDPVCLYVRGCPTSWNTITIQHLLTHTSGIPEYVFTFPLQQSASLDDLIAFFKSKPLDFAPGAKFSYSNSGYVILGSIIEKVSGESYSEFLQQAIVRALHLSNTGEDQNFPPLPEHATGYKQPWEKADYVDMSLVVADGGMYSTVDDLYLWDTALFNRTFASSDSLTQMFSPQVTSCTDQGTICTASDCAAQRVNCFSYGYGWALQQNPVGDQYVRVIFHTGLVPGFASLNSYYPDQKLTLIVLSNLETFTKSSYKMSGTVESAFIVHLAES